MNSKTKPAPGRDSSDAQAQEKKHPLFWRRGLRRAIGAVVVFLALAVIWRLGDDSRAPIISPVSPPDTVLENVRADEALTSVEQELQQAEEFIPSDSSPPVAAEVEESTEEVQETQQKEPEEDVTNDESSDEPEQNIQKESKDDAQELKEETTPEEAVEEVTPEEVEETPPEKPVEETPPEKAVEEKPVPVSPWEVQIGAFLSEVKARQIAGDLEKHDIMMRIEKVDRNGVFLFRVRATGYQKRAEAEVARQEISELGYKNAQVRDNR